MTRKETKVCEARGMHSEGEFENIGGGIFRLTCPECGDSAILTVKDIEKSIIEALAQGGRYTKIERIL